MSLTACLRQDLLWSWRIMRRNLGLTAAVVLSLGLTLGAHTATFSVLNAFLLRPLAIEDIDRVVRVRENLAAPGQGSELRSLSSAYYGTWRDNQQVFTGIAAGTGTNLTLTGTDQPERISAARVSANFFPVLGMRPLLGRTFTPDEDRPGGNRVVVLSYDLWHRQFGGDPKVIGRTVRLDGQPHTVIAVMPRGLHHPYQAEMWVPLAYREETNRGEEYYAPARLKPGVTLEQARVQMNEMVRRLREADPRPQGPQSADLSPMHPELVHGMDMMLYVLVVASTFVLLIACVDISNLLLAQGLKLGPEVAMRVALGATRGRLARQILTYSLLLSLLGAGVGTVLSLWLMKPLIALSPVYALGEFDIEPRLDLPTLAFAFAVAVAVGFIFGMMPALRMSRASVTSSLQEGGWTRTLGRKGRRLFAGLVVAEVALSLVLLVAAGLIVRSFQRLRSEDRGFDMHNVLSFATAFPGFEFPDPLQKAAFIRAALDRLREIPGVVAVGATSTQPLYAGTNAGNFSVEGKPAANERGYHMLHNRIVTPGYLESLRVPLIAGRFFDDRDTTAFPPGVMVSKSLADRYWPGESAVGKRIKPGRYDDESAPWVTVVGVAGTLKETHDEVLSNDDAWYVPAVPMLAAGLDDMTFTVRVRSNLLAVAPVVRDAIRAADKDMPVFDMMTMEQRLVERTAPERLSAGICTALGLLGLVLAAIGIYGVLAFSLNQRLREIGIRSAMGAQPGELRALVFGWGLRLAGIGLAVGALGALAIAKLLSSQLYQVSSHDPVALVSALTSLAAIALLASYLPARRAAKINPVSALRHE
jgi:putative ABC transport system permease protein